MRLAFSHREIVHLAATQCGAYWGPVYSGMDDHTQSGSFFSHNLFSFTRQAFMMIYCSHF
jgi:hypothetical protein